MSLFYGSEVQVGLTGFSALGYTRSQGVGWLGSYEEALGRIQSPLVLFTNAQMYYFHLKMFADILKVMDLRNKSPWCNFHSFFVSLSNKYST